MARDTCPADRSKCPHVEVCMALHCAVNGRYFPVDGDRFLNQAERYHQHMSEQRKQEGRDPCS